MTSMSDLPPSAQAAPLRGGEILANPDHTPHSSDPTPGAATARRFGEFLLSGAVQALMRDFGRERCGEPMYHDAATTARTIQD